MQKGKEDTELRKQKKQRITNQKHFTQPQKWGQVWCFYTHYIYNMEIQLNGIEDFGTFFYEMRKAFIRDGRSLWFDNFYVNAMVVRAHQINKGFLALVETGNYLCAAPLVRIQLETVLRLYGGLIADGDSYIPRFMEGKKVDNCTFNGKQLTYGYLAELLGNFTGLKFLGELYTEGNKYIHPTDTAYKAAHWYKDGKLEVHNLESKLYEDSELEELKSKMFLVNYAYVPVLQEYLKVYHENLAMVEGGESKPVTDKEEIRKFKDTVDGFLDNVKRDTGSNEEAPDNTKNA